MKTIIRPLTLAILLLNIPCKIWAQTNNGQNETQSLHALSAFHIFATDKKTTHIIFPKAILYVDLGSNNLIAGIAEGSRNVLRIKTSANNITEQTNFSVILADGNYYSFNVDYSPSPSVLSYSVELTSESLAAETKHKALMSELDGQSYAQIEQTIGFIKQNDNGKPIKKTQNQNIQVELQDIFVQGDKLYFHLGFRNQSKLDFTPQSITFWIGNKKIVKRTVQQRKELAQRWTNPKIGKIASESYERTVIMLDQFTLSKNQRLNITIKEADGERHLNLRLKHTNLSKVKKITPNFRVAGSVTP